MSKMYLTVLYDKDGEIKAYDPMFAKSSEEEVKKEVEEFNKTEKLEDGDHFGVAEIEFFPNGK